MGLGRKIIKLTESKRVYDKNTGDFYGKSH